MSKFGRFKSEHAEGLEDDCWRDMDKMNTVLNEIVEDTIKREGITKMYLRQYIGEPFKGKGGYK